MPYVKRGANIDGDPSSYWAVYVYEVLMANGHSRAVYDCIKRRWKEMAEYGTTFETFSGIKDKRSGWVGGTLSHAWSAHPAYILPKILTGIKQLKAD